MLEIQTKELPLRWLSPGILPDRCTGALAVGQGLRSVERYH